MRLRVGCVIASSLTLFCLAAGAQEPPPTFGLVPAPPVEQPVPPVPAEGANTTGWLAAQILLGQQCGIRGQATLARLGNWTLVGEGFYGALLTKFGASETAGCGVRGLLRRTSPDGHNSLILGPGVNFLEQLRNGGLPVLAPSVDLSWLHGFEGGGGWEIGLNVGLGVSLADEGQDGDVKTGQVTPIISVFSGFRF